MLCRQMLNHHKATEEVLRPQGRVSRAIGSSGDLFGSFWVSKRNTSRQYAGTKKGHRKVAALGGHALCGGSQIIWLTPAQAG